MAPFSNRRSPAVCVGTSTSTTAPRLGLLVITRWGNAIPVIPLMLCTRPIRFTNAVI